MIRGSAGYLQSKSMDKKAETVATLHIFKPNEEGEQLVSLTHGETICIGRALDNQVVLIDPLASRWHALFTATSNGIVLTDLGSLNGTYLNGERVTSRVDLSSKDEVLVGSALISVDVHARDTAAYLRTHSVLEHGAGLLEDINATVLIAHIQDYKSLFEKYPEEVARDVLHRWQKRVCELIDTFGGRIDKVFQESIIAIWVGIDQNDLASNAIRTALNINTVASDLADEFGDSSTTRPDLACKTIISSGAGVAGHVQDPSAAELTQFVIIDEPFNSAFFLEELSSLLGDSIIISAETAALVGDAFSLRHLNISIEGEDLPAVYTMQDQT